MLCRKVYIANRNILAIIMNLDSSTSFDEVQFPRRKKTPHFMIDEVNGGQNHKGMYLNRTCQKSGMIDVFPVFNASLNVRDILLVLSLQIK